MIQLLRLFNKFLMVGKEERIYSTQVFNKHFNKEKVYVWREL